MYDLFVPVIEGKENAQLHRISFKLELDNKSDHWNTPPIITGAKFKPTFRNIENYFTSMYKDANSASVYFSQEENGKPSLNLTDSTMSVMLGIFLCAAASKITGWKIKDSWQSITATGTFEEPDFRQEFNGILNLEAISEPKEKLKAFEKYANDKKNIRDNGKKHLFIYINEDSSLTYENDIIHVKSFSSLDNTLFDILDFVFELPVLPVMILEKKQEKYFDEFKENSDYVIKQNINISDIFNKINKNDEYKYKHIYIHDQDNNGKFFAFLFARYMVWNRKIYAPIWIKIDSKPQTDDENIIPTEIQDKLFLSLFTKEKKEKNVSNCLSIFNEKPFLLILDNIPDDINSLNVFISRIEIFCKNINKKSMVIFIGKNNYDSKKSKFIKPFFNQPEKDNKRKEIIITKPVKVSKPSKPAVSLFKFPIFTGNLKRKILIGSSLIIGIILIFSLISLIGIGKSPNINNSEEVFFEMLIPEGLEYEIIDEKYVTITGYTGEDINLIIPAFIRSLPVRTIGRRAFADNDVIKNVIIPSTVTTIGNQAFVYCDALEIINIPESVTKIENFAFTACNNLKYINVHLNNKYYKSINGVLFNKDAGVLLSYPAGKTEEEYKIPSTVINIGRAAFVESTNLKKIYIPSSVKIISQSAFYYSDNLENIYIPLSVVYIGINAFYGCSGITSVNIPSSVTVIDNRAFDNCTSLENIHIPSSVTYIGEYAFRNCNSLKNVIIEASINTLKEAVFAHCKSLEEITIPSTVKIIEKWAFNVSGLKSIIIPASVNKIGVNAFSHCYNLESADIPATVAVIEDFAFANTSLSRVTISRNTILGTNVFDSRVRIQYYEQESRPTQVSGNIPDIILVPSNEYFTVRMEPITLERIVRLPLTAVSNNDEQLEVISKQQIQPIQRTQYTHGDFTYEILNNITNNIAITRYTGDDKNVVIPLNINSSPNIIGSRRVTSIREGAFRGNNNLENVSIPLSLTSIGNFAFSDCINLENVNIPSSVLTIGTGAFSNCPKLTAITISRNTIVGSGAFDPGVEIRYYD
ncbi:MAG: leucine-rich repeat domain-containing protein [Treponema sp.]|nr:leucine-rich repeat domain-containing protein [Treponema sp.]